MKQILCFGDSNTYGLVPGTTSRYEWQDRWTGIVQKEVEDKGYRILEEGLCGRTTTFDDPLRSGRRGTELLPVLLETHDPLEAVILMLGTNDCKTVYDAAAGVIGLGMKQLVKQVKTMAPRARILLISPISLGEDVWAGFDPEFNEAAVDKSRELKAVYEKVAMEEGVFYLAASDHAHPSEADREHLDKEGHKALARAVVRKLAETLT